jgi:peptidoglycan-associated lipoprotein
MIRFAVPRTAAAVLMTSLFAVVACGGKKAPVARPQPPPVAPQTAGNSASSTPTRPPSPPTPVEEPIRVPPEPGREESISSASLDDLNRNSPLKPVFFALDSSELTPGGQSALDENGAVLKKNPTWTITIEGHCSEEGTAEYNLALGERRAVTARAYLISLGIPAERLRTVSYGKEFPFDPGHEESALAKNRRAHFVITAK